MTDATLLNLDWALRGGTIAILLLLASALWRDYGRLLSARLAAGFAVGSAAYAICSAAGVHGQPTPWLVPLLAVTAGNNVVFWLLASTLFDESFRLRPWHGTLWLLMAGLGVAECVFIGSRGLGIALTLSSLGFAVAAVAQTASTWRSDLVEGRRRARLFIVGASSAYIVGTALSQLLGGPPAAADSADVAGSASLLTIVGIAAWLLLSVGRRHSLFFVTATPAVPANPGPQPDAVDAGLLAGLERLMTVERAYRQDGLTIGALAQKLNLPEYRLRRLINQALGYRNFNSFLNHYRIKDAQAALADQSQAAVPVLTIAMDAGFSSLGPFNRAFKAETGLTPSDYRRANGGIGEPIPDSTSLVSNPARGNLAGE